MSLRSSFVLLVLGPVTVVVATACSTLNAPARVQDPDVLVLDVVLPLKLSQLNAGQPAVGKNQIAYKVGRFDGVEWPASIASITNGGLHPGRWFSDDQKMFDDVAEANGQNANEDQTYAGKHEVVKPYSTRVDRTGADPGDPGSYSVRLKGKGGELDKQPVGIGNDERTMKTVVLAPDGAYYLTDGHHQALTFSTMTRGGDRGSRNEDFTLNVLLKDDHSGLTDGNGNGSAMDEFWVAAANEGQVWLKRLRNDDFGYQYLPGVTGSNTKYAVDSVDLDLFDREGALPTEMRLEGFEDDPYRSILYFCRGIGWDKPSGEGTAEGLPFLEFYWAEEIQNAIRKEGQAQLDLHTSASPYDLTDLVSYVDAVRAVSEWMAGLDVDRPIGTSGYSAGQMGQLDLDESGWATLGALIDASETSKPLEPKDSDEPDAASIGELPKPGKWAWAWAARHGEAAILSDGSGR